MRAVNLLPEDRRGARRGSLLAALRQQPLLVVAVVVAIAVLGGLAFEVHSAASTVTTRQQTLRELEAQVAKLPKPETVGTSAAAIHASRLGVVTSVAQSRTTWDGFLYAVSRVIPEDVWLLSLSANTTNSGTTSAPAPAPPTPGASAPGAFTITGYTYSQPSVARLMRRLRLVPWLSGVSLTTSSKTSLANKIVYQFTVGASVDPLPEVKS
jgi:Tfp pilus assembly protein PilN